VQYLNARYKIKVIEGEDYDHLIARIREIFGQQVCNMIPDQVKDHKIFLARRNKIKVETNHPVLSIEELEEDQLYNLMFAEKDTVSRINRLTEVDLSEFPNSK